MSTTDTLGGLPLPQDIPFQLIAASPDMMDVRFCDKRFPFEFRSSIAIYGYEPKDLPEPACSGRITYLKIAVSITGYKPTQSELMGHIVDLPGVPTAQLFDNYNDIIRKYFPCFGALLNIAVFPPSGSGVPLTKYPHIIAFEPKSRDLMVATTLEGEILNQSSGKIHTDFSTKSTKSTKLEIVPSAKFERPPISASLTGTFSNETTRERDNSSGTEMESTTAYKRGFSTEIEQMYNMLTGYHVGTNRANFLILPYPHIAQTTEFRTFAQGIRVIEGIQEFFLIIARPIEMKGFCIEAGLQTGHFPEDVEVIAPEPRYKTEEITLDFLLHVTDGTQTSTRPVPIPPGFIIDTSKGNAGVDNADIGSNNAGNEDWGNTGQVSNDLNGVVVSATGHKRTLGPGSIIHRLITVHIRSIEPIGEVPKHANVDDLFITSRGLCACVTSNPPCLNVISVSTPRSGRTPDGKGPDGREIVDETSVRLHDSLNSENPPVRELLKGVRNRLFTSAQQPTRYEEGTTGYFDSKYFAKKWLELLPESYKSKKVADFREISEFRKIPERTIRELANLTISDVASMSLKTFAEISKLDISVAGTLRRKLMGIVEVAQTSGDESATDKSSC
ncbi:MAG: hypothetical protein ABI876_06620 [Bacteroidota bacterium]